MEMAGGRIAISGAEIAMDSVTSTGAAENLAVLRIARTISDRGAAISTGTTATIVGRIGVRSMDAITVIPRANLIFGAGEGRERIQTQCEHRGEWIPRAPQAAPGPSLPGFRQRALRRSEGTPDRTLVQLTAPRAERILNGPTHASRPANLSRDSLPRGNHSYATDRDANILRELPHRTARPVTTACSRTPRLRKCRRLPR